MRGSRAIAWAACLAWATAAAEPAAQGERGPTAAPDEFLGGVVAESRVLYPLQVGSWMAESEHRYPDQRLGVSVRYVDNRKQRWIDLYFYPAGPQVARMLEVVAASERESIDMAAREDARAAELGDLAPLTLGGPGADAAGVPAWELGLRYRGEGLASAMLLFARQMYLVKARASAAEPPATVRSLQGELRTFMESVAAQVRIASTGTCWLPARIELVPRLPDPQQALASYRAGDELAAVVLGDRALVAAGQADRATEIAAQLAGSLYPGCVAPELIEPEVPPALREIRIEYRRPQRAPDLRAPPAAGPHAPSRATG